MARRYLGLETTCDETAAAVFTDEPKVLSSVVASQAARHAEFGGVVPEIAAREHLRMLLPIVRQALAESNTALGDLAGIAVAQGPGLVGSILVGLTAAKTLAWALGVPFVGVDHLHAHLYACRLHAGRDVFPCVGAVFSGGHSHLFACRGARDMRLLGATIDDAAGEAFDKIASMLGLGYPGGPAIEIAARAGNAAAYRFPRTFIKEDRLDFSFSGLKTAVRYALFGQHAEHAGRTLSVPEIADAAASFQQAVVDVAVAKCRQACARTGHRRLCVGGGVAANAALRSGLEKMAEAAGIDLVLAPPSWCTDNAAMLALAAERLRAGDSDPLDLDAAAGLVRRPADLP